MKYKFATCAVAMAVCVFIFITAPLKRFCEQGLLPAAVILIYHIPNAVKSSCSLRGVLPQPLVEKKSEQAEDDGLGMFITQDIWTLFEVLLSYFSNTLSFVV